MKFKNLIQEINTIGLTVEEAAKKFNVEERAIYYWIKHNIIPSYKVKSKVLIDPSDIPTFQRNYPKYKLTLDSKDEKR